jgi:hypothetical protein
VSVIGLVAVDAAHKNKEFNLIIVVFGCNFLTVVKHINKLTEFNEYHM